MKSMTLRFFIIIILVYCTTFGEVQYLDASPIQQSYSMPTAADLPFYINYARTDNMWSKLSTISVTTTTGVVANIATRTLLSNESGALVVDSSTTGSTITLPTPSAGMQFDIIYSASATTGTVKIITDAATTYIAGGITVLTTTATAVTSQFICDGSSHIAISMNKTTSGGLIGTRLRFIGLSATLWEVQGISNSGATVGGSTPLVTPCSAS